MLMATPGELNDDRFQNYGVVAPSGRARIVRLWGERARVSSRGSSFER